MKRGILAVLLAILVVAAFAACASQDRADSLERRIRALELEQAQGYTQQQQNLANTNNRLVAIGNEINTIGQQIANLDATDKQLSTANSETKRKLSEFEERLDARLINKIMGTPLRYSVTAIGIFLAGILVGIYGRLIAGWFSHQE